MRTITVYIILTLCCLFNATGQSPMEKSPLSMGFGIVDISGDDAIILDPLNVKAVVFRQGDTQIALVECDLTFVHGDETTQAREQASQKTGIPFGNICVAATHTHMGRPHKDIIPAVVKAISDAQASLKPVKIKSASGWQYNISYNRRYLMKDGSIMFNPMFLNPDIVRPVGPIDPEIGITMFYNNADSAVASLLNFAMHLDVVKEYGAYYKKTGVGTRNTVSADYPFWIEQSLRQDFGSNFNSLFLTGCCGNINHWNFSKPGPQSGYKTKSKEVGDSLYNSIIRTLPELKEETPNLASRSMVLQIPLQTFTEEDLAWANQVDKAALSRNSEEREERKEFLNNVKRRRILWLAEQKKAGNDHLALDVQVFRLSNNSAIVTLPGEMFVEHGLTIKNLSPFENTFVVELANNAIGYVPNRKAFPQGGYEVENSRLIPGGGEMMVSAALDMLNELKENIK